LEVQVKLTEAFSFRQIGIWVVGPSDEKTRGNVIRHFMAAYLAMKCFKKNAFVGPSHNCFLSFKDFFEEQVRKTEKLQACGSPRPCRAYKSFLWGVGQMRSQKKRSHQLVVCPQSGAFTSLTCRNGTEARFPFFENHQSQSQAEREIAPLTGHARTVGFPNPFGVP